MRNERDQPEREKKDKWFIIIDLQVSAAGLTLKVTTGIEQG
jgi:hypothetical protein